MKRKNLLLLCVIALVAICLASCSVIENLPGSDKLPGCIELYGSHNVKHVEAKDATCTEAGNIEYWYCEACGTVWSDSANTQQITKESTVIAKTEHEYTYACDAICVHCGELTNEEAKHTIAHVEAKDATCAEPGNIEYWYCTDCGYAWADEKLTKVTNLKSVIIPELECNIVHFEAIAPGCHYNGQIEHWVCYDCERVWQDEALTQLTNIKNVVLPATGNGLLVHMDAVAPGCHDDGCIEHWICYTCEQVWADEALTQLTNIKNVTLPATGEGKLVHIEAVAPGCHYTGNVEYWTCYDCEKVWTDEALTQLSNVKNVVIPELGGELVHVEAKAPTCYENGNIEHWYCENCEQVWQDEARTQLTNHKNVILGAEHTLLVHMDAVEPGCHFTGNVEHWICYACESVWTDEALTQVSNVKNVIIPELGGDVIHVEAVEAVDCQTMGNIEYWYCEDCMQVWSDEARTQLTNMMSVKLGYGEHQYFAACDPVCMVCYEVTNPEAAHNIVFVEALEATCQSMGHIAHYKCTHCNTCWDNELGQGMSINRMIYTFTDCKALYACESKCQWCFADVETEGHTLTHVEAVDSTCIFNGNVEYWTCSDCGGYWLDEALTKSTTANAVKLPFGDHEYFYECDAWCMVCNEYTNYEAAHNISKVDAKAPTCITLGNIEYYTCEYCNGCWDNEDAFGMPLNQMMVKIDYVECETATPCDTTCKWCFNVINEDAAHNIVFVPASPVTCLEAGCTTDHYYCTNCHSAWLDKELTLYVSKCSLMIPTKGEHTYTYKCDKVCNVCLEVTAPDADHTIVHVEAWAGTCVELGNVEYWYCSDCGSAWLDEARELVTNLKSVKTTLGDHGYFYACDPVCMYCYEITNPDAAHDLTHVERVEATCTELGNVEYWTCSHCGGCWDNADATGMPLNRMSVIIPMAEHEYFYACDPVCMNCYEITNPGAEHNIVHVAAVDATCTVNGNIEYWYCSICGYAWADVDLTLVTNQMSVVTPATGHDYNAVVTAPTCTEDGYTTHTCANCDDKYVDDEVAALGHDYESVVTAPTCTADGYTTYTCADCGDEYVDDEVAALGHTGLDDLVCDGCEEFITPVAGSTLTIKQAIALANHIGINNFTTAEYYMTAEIVDVYNTTFGNANVVDEDGNKYVFYGFYDENGNRYDALSYKPTTGDIVTVYGVIGSYQKNSSSSITYELKNGVIDELIAHEHNYTSVVTDPTCTKGGYTTHTCSICKDSYKDAETEATGHTTANGVCGNCGFTIGGDVVNNETFTADFNTVASTNTSYVTSTTTSGWKAVNAAVLKGGSSNSSPAFTMIGDDSNRAFCMNGKTSAKGSITSDTISGGISKLSLKYGLPFSDTKIGFTINIKQNGVVVATKTVSNTSATKQQAYTLDWDLEAEGVAVSGDFVIEILNNSPSNSTSNKDRTAIWDVQWTTNY